MTPELALCDEVHEDIRVLLLEGTPVQSSVFQKWYVEVEIPVDRETTQLEYLNDPIAFLPPE